MKQAFQLKGSLLTFTVLQLFETDSEMFSQQLAALVKKTPNFFRNAPVVIDLENIQENHVSIDFACIKSELIRHGLIPVGVRNGNEQQTNAAVAVGLGMLPASKTEQPKPQITADKNITSKLITQPVRSGQQIYAQHTDLIITASVSPGAEVIADGHIHIYGSLRGRAIAGANGDASARIFCRKLEAELISIAGFYKLHDDIKDLPKGANGIQIFLEDEKLNIIPV